MRIEEPVVKILMQYWDPIEVKSTTEAQGEYDSYALQLFGMLVRGANEDAIISFLNESLNHMGISPNKNNNSLVAKKLLALNLKK